MTPSASISLAPLPHRLVEEAVARALAEDLGLAGDLTSQACIPPSATARAALGARQAGVVAGLALAIETFRQIDSTLTVEVLRADGARIGVNETILAVWGNARAILAAERTALNFLGRLCGIATLTAAYVDRVNHTRAAIVCTRKTTPGLRAFEKHAVRCGGGRNHRFGLFDAVLIKDNHIAVAGGVAPALRAAKRSVGHLVKIEIEIDSLLQLDEVVSEGADVVMLDNMRPVDMALAVVRAKPIRPVMLIEASGGVNLETVAQIAETGVDLVSVGALTHSAPVLDLGLDIVIG